VGVAAPVGAGRSEGQQGSHRARTLQDYS